ncbi:MAG: hypothetical protein IJ819_04070 [Clostridiales bacterium]|nr:hypothetical protein [Clostridiales bacterium]
MEEFKLRSLRLKAKAIGIAGSAALICALLLECCTFTGAGAGASVTLLEFIGPKMITVFGLVEMAIVFSILNYALPQFLTGSFIGLWAGFICREILKTHGAVIGAGVYVLILSAAFILASGIVFAVAEHKYKVYGKTDRKARLLRKLEVFCNAALGLSIVLFCVFEALMNHK